MGDAIWQIWIDTGGTFTDCVALDPDGKLRSCKVLSSGTLRDVVKAADEDGHVRLRAADDLPAGFLIGFDLVPLAGAGQYRILDHHGADCTLQLTNGDGYGLTQGTAVELRSDVEAPLLAARLVTGTPLGHDLPPIAMRLATTRGTNALLERRGARVAHFTTAGFEDLLTIGDQRRPDLFALRIERPEPLPETVVGVRERLAADGSVLVPLDTDAVGRDIARLRELGFDCASIALLHGQRDGRHEERLEAKLLNAGFTHVARSSVVCPFQGLLRRAQTTATDSYLGPEIAGYLEGVRIGLGSAHTSLHVMTSAGGLVAAHQYRPVDSLLSGPAGGVVGAAMAGRGAGLERVIGFDMGGTSTDVARFDGDFEYTFEHTVGPVRLVAPALAIETVAAGGGSICRAAEGRLTVGPDSAGAVPGPACYGMSGPLTLTDVNLLLGRLVSDRFPIPINVEAAGKKFQQLRRDLGETDADDEAILEGLLRIADERMAEAIRHISVRKGMDPADYALVAFGGAGGQHACRIAEILEIDEILLPGDAGLLSAFGLGQSVIERFAQREILRPLHEVVEQLDDWLHELEAEAEQDIAAEGVATAEREVARRIVELRYVGQDATLEIEPPSAADLAALFERRYFELFSHRPPDRAIEVVSLRVVVRSRRQELPGSRDPGKNRTDLTADPSGFQGCFLDGRWQEVPFYQASALPGAFATDGPVLVHQLHSALVVPPGWRIRSVGGGGVRVRRTVLEHQSLMSAVGPRRPRAVERELMSHRFVSIARDMGELLQRTAISTNIKERRDFSCTLLDPAGRLVVNAPHIPVHLGALGLCVRELVAHREMAPGDVIITNHPAYGGSHLPDVTLVAPVDTANGRLGYAACRAHHAEIGGVVPGSVPPNARTLSEEGVVIPPTPLVADGEPRWDAIEDLLIRGPHPTRALADNLADLRAMLAAVYRGRSGLVNLAGAVGCDHIVDHMNELRRHAAALVRRALADLPDGVHRGRQLLDDGSPLVAAFIIDGDQAVLDLAGSADVHSGNLNATPAIVASATMYVLRLLVADDLPLNEGLLEPVDLRVPRGLLNPDFVDDPTRCPAVVGGNVETSQRLVDTLIEALGLAACSQGTMNNVSFGDSSFGYYETVAGGSGAGSGFAGVDGVHTHMTNTAATDPEVLEHRYPVRLHRFAIRRGSGGAGHWRGGNGLIREIEFLAPLDLSILSQHRVAAPYGGAGGSDGAVGGQSILRPDGTRIGLEGIDGCSVEPGDRLVLETPGGGGWGRPDS